MKTQHPNIHRSISSGNTEYQRGCLVISRRIQKKDAWRYAILTSSVLKWNVQTFIRMPYSIITYICNVSIRKPSIDTIPKIMNHLLCGTCTNSQIILLRFSQYKLYKLTSLPHDVIGSGVRLIFIMLATICHQCLYSCFIPTELSIHL